MDAAAGASDGATAVTKNEGLGQIIILNGAPRAGKSSIGAAIQEYFEGVWMHLGVDHWMQMIPARFRPGMGLRPGGERPELEPLVVTLYAALYESIAAHSRLGLNVVVDIGHHDAYSFPRALLPACTRRLSGLPVLFVGVRCPLDVILERRRSSGYLAGEPGEGEVPLPVRRWQEAVHQPGIYDLEVDTALLRPEECAACIRQRLYDGRPLTAFGRLASLAISPEA